MFQLVRGHTRDESFRKWQLGGIGTVTSGLSFRELLMPTLYIDV